MVSNTQVYTVTFQDLFQANGSAVKSSHPIVRVDASEHVGV